MVNHIDTLLCRQDEAAHSNLDLQIGKAQLSPILRRLSGKAAWPEGFSKALARPTAAMWVAFRPPGRRSPKPLRLIFAGVCGAYYDDFQRGAGSKRVVDPPRSSDN